MLVFYLLYILLPRSGTSFILPIVQIQAAHRLLELLLQCHFLWALHFDAIELHFVGCHGLLARVLVPKTKSVCVRLDKVLTLHTSPH